MSTVSVRQSLAAGQSPYAIILACSDSRVPPEILFDRGLGEIFIIRVAGNVVAPHELGSIEYALEHLGVPLIMVLGHERCGAVTAAADWAGEVLPENIYSIIDSILPAVYSVQAKHTYATHDEYVDQCIVENIKLVTKQLTTDSHLIKEFFELGKVKIVKGKYDLDDGKVRLIQ
jgi:carbonic anhydrase